MPSNPVIAAYHLIRKEATVKYLIRVSVLVLLLLGSTVFYAFADGVTLKPTKQQGEWSILDSSGTFVGTLKSIDNGAYSLQDSSGLYYGVIKSTGELQTNQRHPLITPDEAQLYLDTLKAISQLKK
jgi:hypothetical protein